MYVVPAERQILGPLVNLMLINGGYNETVVGTVIVFVCLMVFLLCLSVLSVWSSYIALQCPQVQIHDHHAGLWAGHHICPQFPAPSSGAQVSHWHQRSAIIYSFIYL